jgi:glutamine amidotransferase
MCRFICYRGTDLLLADLLYRPSNSLIRQSFHALDRPEPLNGDGFGVGWYQRQITPTPCALTSTMPAWSNQNLRRLSQHVASDCFFAHVRAASPGMRVSHANCHPFQYGRLLWMHNGLVSEFRRIKRRLRASLPDAIYNHIEGTTDSEHAFGLFLNALGDTERICSASEMAEAMVQTIEQLEKWTAEGGPAGPSYYNFAVTDGLSVAAVRYASDPTLEPMSLYCSVFGRYACHKGIGKLLDCHVSERSVIISSERLTSDPNHWHCVPPNHLLMVNPDRTIKIEAMDVSRIGNRVHIPPLSSTSRLAIGIDHTDRHEAAATSRDDSTTDTANPERSEKFVDLWGNSLPW